MPGHAPGDFLVSVIECVIMRNMNIYGLGVGI